MVHGGVLETCGFKDFKTLDLRNTCSMLGQFQGFESGLNLDSKKKNRDCTSGVADSICHILTVVCLPRLEFCDKETQQKWFRRHFELATSFNLPMFLHMRAAAPDFIAILKEHRSGCTHVMHPCNAPICCTAFLHACHLQHFFSV